MSVLEAKALEGLKRLPLDSGMECVRALDIALKAERLILGEPTVRTATDLEAVIRREHERWLVRGVPSGEATG